MPDEEPDVRFRGPRQQSQNENPSAENATPAANVGGRNSSCSPQTHNYGSAAEYAEAVRVWLWAYHNWYLSRYLTPYYLQQSFANPQRLGFGFPAQQTPTQNGTVVHNVRATTANVQNADPAFTSRGVQYVIPTFGRRLLAEAIDFVICFILSLVVTYVLVEVEIIDLEKYEKIFNHEADFKTFIDVTQDLFPIEIVKRLITSVLEAVYLAYGLGTVPPGRSPGKFLMGLKVISCLNVAAVSPRDYRVIVQSTDEKITFLNAIIRSFIKNFALGFLFPICITMYMFRYNRSLYDIASGTIVVEG